MQQHAPENAASAVDDSGQPEAQQNRQQRKAEEGRTLMRVARDEPQRQVPERPDRADEQRRRRPRQLLLQQRLQHPAPAQLLAAAVNGDGLQEDQRDGTYTDRRVPLPRGQADCRRFERKHEQQHRRGALFAAEQERTQTAQRELSVKAQQRGNGRAETADGEQNLRQRVALPQVREPDEQRVALPERPGNEKGQQQIFFQSLHFRFHLFGAAGSTGLFFAVLIQAALHLLNDTYPSTLYFTLLPYFWERSRPSFSNFRTKLRIVA